MGGGGGKGVRGGREKGWVIDILGKVEGDDWCWVVGLRRSGCEGRGLSLPEQRCTEQRYIFNNNNKKRQKIYIYKYKQNKTENEDTNDKETKDAYKAV